MTLARQVNLEDSGTTVVSAHSSREDHSRTGTPPEQENHDPNNVQSSGNEQQIYSTLTSQRYITRPELYKGEQNESAYNSGTFINILCAVIY